MASQTAIDMDNILIFIIQDFREPSISRVIQHATAAAMYPQFVNVATGRIPEGTTNPVDDSTVAFNIYKASTLIIPSDLIRTLLGLHAQELDYERLNQRGNVEGYDVWFRDWRAAKSAAMRYLL